MRISLWSGGKVWSVLYIVVAVDGVPPVCLAVVLDHLWGWSMMFLMTMMVGSSEWDGSALGPRTNRIAAVALVATLQAAAMDGCRLG